MTATMTVVVCTRNRPDQLRTCLQEVGRRLRPDDEMLVVDSASTGPETAAVATAAGMRVVRAELPGLSRARNVGVGASSGEIVVFTDDDCHPQDGWLDAIEKAFAADDRLGVVTGRVVARDATGQGRASVRESLDPELYTSASQADAMGHGANMAFRRRALEAAGPFDEMLGAGGPFRAAEDWDMFWRVLRLGWYGRYEPAAVVSHSQWRGGSAHVRLRYGYSLGAAAFAVKAMRSGDPFGRRLLRRRVVQEGVLSVWRGLRQRRLLRAQSGLATLGGCAVGWWRARRLDLSGDVFQGEVRPMRDAA